MTAAVNAATSAVRLLRDPLGLTPIDEHEDEVVAESSPQRAGRPGAARRDAHATVVTPGPASPELTPGPVLSSSQDGFGLQDELAADSLEISPDTLTGADDPAGLKPTPTLSATAQTP